MEALNNLTQTLEKMVEAHARLLELSKEKRAVLVDGNIQGLQSLIYRESTYAEEISKLEQARKKIVQVFMEQKGYTGHSFTLEEVSKVVGDSAVKTNLNLAAKHLRALIEEISNLNETNQQLIQTSLSYIQYAISMHVPKEQAIGYGPKAEKRYRSLLDAKI